MAATIPDVGTGATITFATTGISLQALSIDIGEITRAVVDTTHLGTTQPSANVVHSKTAMPGKHVEISEIAVEFHWDPQAQDLSIAAAESITATYPDGSTLVGTGFVFNVKGPTLAVDEKQIGSLKIKPSASWTYTEV